MLEQSGRSVLSPVKGQSVVDETIKSIMGAILEGHYKMGEKLPNEYELIKELQISRNSLREAMKVLSTVGVIEIRRGDGTYICDQINPSIFDSLIYGLVFDASSSTELIELRQSLDEIMIKLAIDKADEDDIAELQGFIVSMESSFIKGDLDAAALADYNFHIRIVEAAKNKLLSRIVKGVYQFFRESIYKNITTEEEFAHAAEYHKQLLNLIKTKDKANVEGIVANSLGIWSHNIKPDE